MQASLPPYGAMKAYKQVNKHADKKAYNARTQASINRYILKAYKTMKQASKHTSKQKLKQAYKQAYKK